MDALSIASCVTTGSESSMRRILIIDDDAELGELLAEYLKGDRLLLDFAYDGPAGLARALAGNYALIILDVMLPGMNGFEVLRQLRTHSQTPVLMLTARGDDVDRIVGLEIGADDYLPKPFNPRELVARVNAILRRSQTAQESSPSDIITVGDVELDPRAPHCAPARRADRPDHCRVRPTPRAPAVRRPGGPSRTALPGRSRPRVLGL